MRLTEAEMPVEMTLTAAALVSGIDDPIIWGNGCLGALFAERVGWDLDGMVIELLFQKQLQALFYRRVGSAEVTVTAAINGLEQHRHPSFAQGCVERD